MTDETKGVELRSAGGQNYALFGALTFDSVPLVWQQGLRLIQQSSNVDLDLRAVSHTDSAGLALLVVWAGEARRRSTQIQFCNVPEQLLAIARTSRLGHLFDTSPT